MLFADARSPLTIGLISLILTAHPSFTRADSFTDATGARVHITSPPKRIIPLMPSLAELSADLLGEDMSRIVGVVDRADYPPALSKLPSVGAFHRFNVEKVASLKPELILASTDGNPKDQVIRLRELGFPVLVIETATLNQVAESMILVGRALGEPKRGQDMAEQFRRGSERIRLRAKERKGPSPRVLLQIGSNPLVVAGPDSFLNEALKVVGATNIYENAAHSRYPRPSLEDALNRRPDIILVMSMGSSGGSSAASSDETVRKTAAEWAAFPNLPAVKNNRIRVLEGDALMRPTLRLLEGLALLEKAITE